MDWFWEAIDAQLARVADARSAAEVVAACPGEEDVSVGDGFFAGSGGDTQLIDVLTDAGWRWVDVRAVYHWCLRAPDGSELTYVEGDLYVGNRMPKVIA